MTETQTPTPQYPPYVTDGSHIYIWNDEYARLLEQGKLKASPPPQPKAQKQLSQRQQTKLEEMRKKALHDAQQAVELFKAPIAPAKLEDVFGAPPTDE